MVLRTPMVQLQKNDPSLLPLNERRALDILESTCTKLNRHYTVGLLWKEDNPHLPSNRNLAISGMKSIENQFKRDPTLAYKYKETFKRLYRQRTCHKINTRRSIKFKTIYKLCSSSCSLEHQ